MSYNDEARTTCIAICKETFSACMKAALHCLNSLGIAPNDRCITILMECAEACYSCIRYTNPGSQAQRHAFALCAELCLATVRACESIADRVLEDCLERCRRCAAQCRALSSEGLMAAC